MRASLSVGRGLRSRARGGPCAADAAPRRALAGARGTRGPHGRGGVPRRVRPRAAGESDGDPAAPRRVESTGLRHGDAHGDGAEGWWRSVEVGEGEWRYLPQPPPTSTNLPRPAFLRLRNGRPLLPRALANE